MPAIPFKKLLRTFIIGLERVGATVVELSDVPPTRPYRLVVSADGRSDRYAVFLWTVTPGGGPAGTRPADERRIQITNATSFPLELGVRTIIGGWSEEFGVYAFWDVRRHSAFSRKSPGFHVKSGALERAHHYGVSTHTYGAREGREVVVAVTPPYLLWYLQDGWVLHDLEDDAQAADALTNTSPEAEKDFAESAQTEAQFLRRHQLVEVMRAYRAARFRPEVLKAYRFQCAVCRVALKLIDAAHIIPVQDPRSVDVITNGLALCRLHHAAYDNGLLGIRSDLRTAINTREIARLQSAGLLHGFPEFKAGIPTTIWTPPVAELRPDRTFLRIGLEARRWPSEFVY